MNKCRRYPGGPARQEGPLISSHVQSGCLTCRGAEVVMSFLPPSWKHRAHSRAGASVWPGMRKMAQTPARPTSRGDPNIAFIFGRVVKVHREIPPAPFKIFLSLPSSYLPSWTAYQLAFFAVRNSLVSSCLGARRLGPAVEPETARDLVSFEALLHLRVTACSAVKWR